jgi:hypothetical protein
MLFRSTAFLETIALHALLAPGFLGGKSENPPMVSNRHVQWELTGVLKRSMEIRVNADVTLSSH